MILLEFIYQQGYNIGKGGDRMRTYNEQHKHWPDAHRESYRQSFLTMFIGAGLAWIGIGSFLCLLSVPVGCISILSGVAILVYGLIYCRR